MHQCRQSAILYRPFLICLKLSSFIAASPPRRLYQNKVIPGGGIQNLLGKSVTNWEAYKTHFLLSLQRCSITIYLHSLFSRKWSESNIFRHAGVAYIRIRRLSSLICKRREIRNCFQHGPLRFPAAHCLTGSAFKVEEGRQFLIQSSGAVWKSRWPSWAFRSNEPYGFCGRFGIGHNLSVICPPTSEDMKLHFVSSWGGL